MIQQKVTLYVPEKWQECLADTELNKYSSITLIEKLNPDS
jgi:hypothetical protein